MIKLSDMKEKEVINISNGERLGYIYDFEVDLEKGRLIAIVMIGSGRILGMFGKNNDLLINWKDIIKIGSDTILVNIPTEVKSN